MFRKIRFVLRRRYLWVPRPVKKAIVLVIGGTVLLLGIIMMVAPGPAFIVIPLGLAILAIEFVWARRWLKKIKKSLMNVKDKLTGKGAAATTPVNGCGNKPSAAA